MERGNLLLQVVLSAISALALSWCDGGDSKCSATNPCVDGYICNKHGDCIEGTDLIINTSTLPDAYVDDPYEAQLQASGGIPPYQWSVQSNLAWLGAEEIGADIWALTGTPDASTLPGGVTVTLEISDDSLDGGNLTPKDLTLVVHECVESRKRACYVPQAGICVSGDQICNNSTWGSCDVSGGPSTDIDYCGVDCTTCGTNADKCVGGLCACGDGSPCTGNLICCFGICVDDVECGTCGDGVKGEWEECDKLDKGEETCLTLNYYGGNLHCLDDCSFDLTECEAAGWCGDIQINGQEDCDGTELGTSTCETYGYQPGDLSCTPDCEYDVTDCCGDGTTGPNEDCDDQNQEPWDGCDGCRITEFIVNSNTTPDQIGSSVVLGETGTIVVAWDSWEQDGSGCGVYCQLLDSNGVPLSSELRINTTTDMDQIWSSLAMDDYGNFVVAWSGQSASTSTDIYIQRYDSGGNTIGAETRVNTWTANTQELGRVASDRDGNFTVVWESQGQDGSGYGVYGQRYLADGNPTGSEFKVNTYTEQSQRFPWIAVSDSGHMVIVWQSDGQDGSSNGIFGQCFNTNGSQKGTEFQANTTTIGDQHLPRVTIDSEGSFVVVWSSAELDGSSEQIFGQLYDSNCDRVGGEFQISNSTDRKHYFPNVSMDAEGNFVVVWIRFVQSTEDNVVGRRFDANGNPLSGEFQINSRSNELIGQPALSMNSQGRFIVTWDSGDFGACDIAAQRFNSLGEARGREPW